MNSKKIALVATIAVIALVAAGIGYAYTASTLNENNDATREFVELTQSGTGKYQFSDGFEIYYDSVNSGTRTSSNTVYHLTDNVDVGTIIPGQTVVQLGDPFTLKASQVGGDGNDLPCVFTTSGFNIDNSWNFYIKVNNGETITNFTTTGDDAWNNSATFIIEKAETIGSYKDVEITVYYGYPTSNEPTYDNGTKPDRNVLDGASLTFTVTVEGANKVTSWPADTIVTTTSAIAYTGGNIDIPEVTVKVGEATLTKDTDYTLYWSGPDGTAVTKLHDSGIYTATITGIGATYGDYGFIYAECIVGTALPVLTVTFSPETQTTADGSAPTITVKNGEAVFDNQNYIYGWTNADGTAISWDTAGTKILTLTGAKGYYGTTSVEFEVTAQP